MSNVIKVDFRGGAAPAELIRRELNSYEESLRAAIDLHQWRAEGYQDSLDWETAALEISMADGLIKALNLYNLWSL